jgi:rhamnopyranosyl-N-acetylglucosaminyl-diphospho-decaprenol beta-1,3/1,4-galactofuranosyltransferase
MSVCAVVVTFNRKTLLRICLDSLFAQTRPIDRILVVDNASTDGTDTVLRDDFPNLEVLRLPENSGGSGGFHAGMAWAVEKEFDWVWVMDDDVRMRPEALETMLSYEAIADMIQPRKAINGSVLIWEAIWDANACSTIAYDREASFDNGRDWTSVSYGCFEGALIRRALIERTGLPDARFFVMGDDTVYGFVASQYGRVIYLRYIGVEKDVELVDGFPRLTRMGLYLQTRNRFLTAEILARCGVPVSRKLLLLHELNLVLASWMVVARHADLRKWVNVRAPLEGLLHGLQGRFGKPYWIR